MEDDCEFEHEFDDTNLLGNKYDAAEFVHGDEGEHVEYIIEKLLMTPKRSSNTQRNALFRTRCTVAQKVCDLIVDNGSTENIVSKALVKAPSLPTEKHPNPYEVGWIKIGAAGQVTEVCRVSFSIDKLYQGELTFDVLDMDACHLLLGRP